MQSPAISPNPIRNSSASASLTFTEGVLSGAINWKLLQEQLRGEAAYKEEVLQMLQQRREDDAFTAGRDLVKKMDEGETFH